MKMTHKEIEEALDQPGFALDNLPEAEQRLLVDTVCGLVARAATSNVPYAVALTAIERLRGAAATEIEDHMKDRYCLNDMTMPQDVAFMWAKGIHRIDAKAFLDEAIQDADEAPVTAQN